MDVVSLSKPQRAWVNALLKGMSTAAIGQNLNLKIVQVATKLSAI
jgi:hypothetical protein